MTNQSMPQLKRLAARKYHCNDLAALHSWLEAQGYQYYGQHDPGEYGRFSYQEAHDQEEGRTFANGYIQVMNDGEVYSPDAHAWDLLDQLLEDDEPEQSA